MIALPLRFQIKNLATLGRRHSLRPARGHSLRPAEEFGYLFLPPIR